MCTVFPLIPFQDISTWQLIQVRPALCVKSLSPLSNPCQLNWSTCFSCMLRSVTYCCCLWESSFSFSLVPPHIPALELESVVRTWVMLQKQMTLRSWFLKIVKYSFNSLNMSSMRLLWFLLHVIFVSGVPLVEWPLSGTLLSRRETKPCSHVLLQQGGNSWSSHTGGNCGVGIKYEWAVLGSATILEQDSVTIGKTLIQT